MKKAMFGPILIVVLVCLGSLVQGQSNYQPYTGPGPNSVVWHVGSATTLADGTQTLTDVVIEVRGIVLRADQVIHRASAVSLELQGNVRVTLPGQSAK